MLNSVGYLACLVGIGPAVALAMYLGLVSKVASAPGLPGLGRLLLQLLELVGTPWKLIAIVLGVLALLVAGCVNASRGWACLVVGVLGVGCLVQVIVIARPTVPAEFVILVPSAVASAIALGWSWQLLRGDLFA